MQTDISQRFLFEHHAIRGEIVRIERAYQTILSQRPYPESITHFLGQTLLANILLSNTLKYEGQTTIQMQQEDSPIKMLVTKCNHHSHIRALASWHESCSDSILSDTLSKGKLVITVQPDHNTNFYQSIVAIDQQAISTVMEHFFLQSEQIPTRLWLAADQHRAVGIALQKMPTNENAQLTEDDIWEEVVLLADTLSQQELLSLNNTDILHRLYHQHDVRIFEPKPITFQCSCSQSKMEGALLATGKEEAEQILEEHQAIVVTCEYCQAEFSFSPEQVHTIFSHH